jgi:hypothetical protein
MDLALLDRKLEKAFARSRTEKIVAGTLKWRKEPAPLWEYVEQVLDAEEREQFDSLEYWPGSVSELLGERLVDVLGFYWDGFGPMSWSAGTQILDCGDHGWLCYWDEMSSYQAVARLEPWRDGEIVSSAVASLLGETGRRQDLGFFIGSLPNGTDNRSPDLLPTSVVRQAYFDWLQWDEDGSAWNELAEEHFGRIVEPDHLERSLGALRRLPRLDDPEAVSAYLEDDDAPELDEKAKQTLFEEWFASTYEVSAPRAPST